MVKVPDRPGVIREITVALGDANINIEDIALHHMSAELGGALTVYVSGDDVCRRGAAAAGRARLRGDHRESGRVTTGSEVLFKPARRLRGRVTVPADKSITQRALILAALCDQPVRISNPLWAGDTEATASMLTAMGVRIVRSRGGGRSTQVSGRGLRGLCSPHGVLDARNSATAMRLLAGVCAGQQGRFEFDGDESLRRRPMDRVVEPLRRMGVDIEARDGRFAPLVVNGGTVVATSYRSAGRQRPGEVGGAAGGPVRRGRHHGAASRCQAVTIPSACCRLPVCRCAVRASTDHGQRCGAPRP